MNTTTDSPTRLYLMQFAIDEADGTPMPGYLIQTSHGTNVLIDTGWPKSLIGAYKQPGSMGIRMDEEDYVVHQLRTLGLTPHDIHFLVCTHFDPDHSGNHDDFPETQLVVQRAHYEAARASETPRFAMNRQHWDHPSLRYQFVDGDTELLPGIRLIETSGHCPGHQSVLVHLPETGPVLLAIDAILRMADLDPDKREMTHYDMDEASVRASTRKLVALAQQEQVTLIVCGHDPNQWKTLKKAPEYYS